MCAVWGFDEGVCVRGRRYQNTWTAAVNEPQRIILVRKSHPDSVQVNIALGEVAAGARVHFRNDEDAPAVVQPTLHHSGQSS